MGQSINIQALLRNIDADNVTRLCHPPIPSLLVRATRPIQLFGLGRREGDHADGRSHDPGGIRSHLRGGRVVVRGGRRQRYNRNSAYKGGWEFSLHPVIALEVGSGVKNGCSALDHLPSGLPSIADVLLPCRGLAV